MAMFPRAFLVSSRRSVDAGEVVELTVRDLLGHWGVAELDDKAVGRIDAGLRRALLKTDPDFVSAPLDSMIALVDHSDPRVVGRRRSPKTPKPSPKNQRADMTRRVTDVLATLGGIKLSAFDESLEDSTDPYVDARILDDIVVWVESLGVPRGGVWLHVRLIEELPDDARVVRGVATLEPRPFRSTSLHQDEPGSFSLEVTVLLTADALEAVDYAVASAVDDARRVINEVVECLDAPPISASSHLMPSSTRPTGSMPERSIDEVLAEFSKLVGVDDVQRQVNDMVANAQVHQARLAAGLKSAPFTPHLVFTGNPGTGKTTVARLIAQLYRALGLLASGHLVEVSRTDLVGKYIGQSEARTIERINEASGGVLFIDEAYSLSGKHENDYGREIIEVLLVEMENRRGEFAVIVAGYAMEMTGFLAANPGLQSRFDHIIHFRDFDLDELVDIFRRRAESEDYRLGDGVLEAVRRELERVDRSLNFSNGRSVRRLFDRTKINQQRRLIEAGTLDIDSLQTILSGDVASAGDLQPVTRRPIGFR